MVIEMSEESVALALADVEGLSITGVDVDVDVGLEYVADLAG
jgi:hypothetical protein